MRGHHVFISLWVLLAAPANSIAADSSGDGHPLIPLLRMAYRAYQRMDHGIRDYTCTLTKRERVRGQLRNYETMYVKVRHQRLENGRVVVPFSVYLRYVRPRSLAGREVLYVHGRNHGKMIVRRGGTRFAYVTVGIPPDSERVFRDNRYPITEIGVKNLTRRLIEDGKNELQYDDIRVKLTPGAKIDGRPCTLLEVRHTVRHPESTYQFARIMIDDELQLPVYYAAYDWPREEGGSAPLIEEYTYTNLRLNVGLTDWDFDHRNKEYGFRKSFEP